MNQDTKTKLRETHRQMMTNLEETMLKCKSPEDSIFYYHSSENRIVLSHALFWDDDSITKREGGKGEEHAPHPSVPRGDAGGIAHGG